MSDWLDIKSARKLPPNTQILVYRPLADRTSDAIIRTVYTTSRDSGCWKDTVPPGCDGKNFTDAYCYPSHWMPLPPAPR